MINSNVSGIILEGIAGTGKTTLLRSLLKSDAWAAKHHMSSIVLTEHQTLRVLESKRETNSYGKSDSVSLLDRHVSYLNGLKGNLDNTEWLQRDRTAQQLTFILERFHLSHVYHYEHLEWQDVKYIDDILKGLGTKIFLLTIDETDIQKRIIDDYEKAGWKDYLSTLGNSDDKIINYFIQKQNELLHLAKLSAVPIEIIDTSKLSPVEAHAIIIKNSKLIH